MAAFCTAMRRWNTFKDILRRRASVPSLCFSTADTLTNSSDRDSDSGAGDKIDGTTRHVSNDDSAGPSATSTTAFMLPQNQQDEKAGMLRSPKMKTCIKIRDWAGKNPVLCLCALLVPAVGIPVSLRLGQDNVVDTLVLFTLWLGFQALQAKVKGCPKQGGHSKIRVVIASLLNSVLWTALVMIVYVRVKASARQADFAGALGSLQSNITVVDVFSHNSNTSAAGSSYAAVHLPPSGGENKNTTLNGAVTNVASSLPAVSRVMQAGDIALSILDAGLVAWGLKLYECRRQLLSRSGFTVAFVAALSAAGNVCAGPLLASKFGLGPGSRDLSFAARSVTLALAVPAMGVLGGDVGLNAAMVVANGVLFQIGMGLGVGRWLEGLLRWRLGWRLGRKPEAQGVDTKRWSLFRCPSCRDSSSLGHVHDLEAAAAVTDNQPQVGERPTVQPDEDQPPGRLHDTECDATAEDRTHGRCQRSSAPTSATDTPRTVAAGVTVGINAAAMGTAHLYEEGSRAAPFSALAMTAFGVVTVILTNAMSRWLVAEV